MTDSIHRLKTFLNENGYDPFHKNIERDGDEDKSRRRIILIILHLFTQKKKNFFVLV